MKRWLNWETSNKEEGEKVKAFLSTNKIKFESSGCFEGVHIEVCVDAAEEQAVNNFLDTL